MANKKFYAITKNGGHAAGSKDMIDVLLSVPGWFSASRDEYLKAKRKSRALDKAQAEA